MEKPGLHHKYSPEATSGVVFPRLVTLPQLFNLAWSKHSGRGDLLGTQKLSVYSRKSPRNQRSIGIANPRLGRSNKSRRTWRSPAGSGSIAAGFGNVLTFSR